MVSGIIPQLYAALLQNPQEIKDSDKYSADFIIHNFSVGSFFLFFLKDEHVSQSQLMPSVTAKLQICQCEWTRKPRHIHCWQQSLHCENPSCESQKVAYKVTDEQQRPSVTDYLNYWASLTVVMFKN